MKLLDFVNYVSFQNKKTNPGLKYLAQSHFKLGFRYFLKKQAARRALASLLVKETRRLVKRVIKDKLLPLTAKVSVDAFRQMSLKHTIDVFKQEVPFLHDILVAAFTALTGRGYETR
ncbi:hypothetical protein DPMN_123272 [Dreissena polymorpha]|uniref:Uncharacterized protein n=1 Tax=Dreissena polymorpha TaxID=45954 RepID=A0A9D4JUZ8_DREPO|nr:hypothetical protein DPMN_123272 [Dreissena polymorpha]